MFMPTTDVLIIGAGIAGLGAGLKLQRQGYQVTILEARNHAGGRIATVEHQQPSSHINGARSNAWSELGAEFVHGMEPHLLSLFNEAGLLLNEESGTFSFIHSGQVLDAHEDVKGSATILAALYAYVGPDCSAQDFLQQHFASKHWQQARAQVVSYIEGFNAARLEDVSVHWLQRSQHAADSINEERQFRPLFGYSRLVDWLVQQLGSESIVYEQEVQRLSWSPGSVTVQTRNAQGGRENWQARATIVTVPLGVWQAPAGARGAIAYEPDLPGKWKAAQDLRMGAAMRVVFHFDDFFWEQEGEQQQTALPGLGFLRSDDPTFPVWWTQAPLRVPTLTAWVGGTQALPLAEADEASLVEQALQALSRTIGRSVETLQSHILSTATHNWSRDPYSRGAYSYVPVGAVDAPTRLAEPLENTLFFAGEATDTLGFTGTVHSALLTGYRAASEVTTVLRPSSSH
ncbi:hypothetical protein KSC_088130 [Ktedonobacter sp. SOSP1-52]|nr:hypothetical protein KSC_088130 [Ktedonobacter sp. SOSP1-52]